MNQPAGPSSGAEDHGAERDSTELDFFLDRLPLKERVFLYHKSIGTDGWSIQHLVYLKTRRATNESQATKDFDVNEQKRVAARVSAIFKQRSWEVSEENWGRYAASGMTEENDFDLCFHVTDQEATKIQCGNGTLGIKKVPFPKTHPSRMPTNFPGYKGAKDRFDKNRLCMRHEKEAKDPRAAQETLAMHWTAAGLSAAEIMKRRQG